MTRMAVPWKTTVSVMAESRDLTVLQTVKDELNVTDNSKDEVLSRFINQASQIIVTFCNREFAEETLVDTFRLQEFGWSIDGLILSRIPVTSITLITEDGTALTASEYETDLATGLVYRIEDDERTSWASAKVVVTYVAGFELLTTLPHDVERACIELVKLSYFARGRDPMVKSEDVPGVLSQTFWVGAVGDNGAIPPDVADKLNPYRMVQV